MGSEDGLARKAGEDAERYSRLRQRAWDAMGSAEGWGVNGQAELGQTRRACGLRGGVESSRRSWSLGRHARRSSVKIWQLRARQLAGG